MIFKQIYRRVASSNEEGIALIMVISLFAILSILIGSGFVFSLSSSQAAENDENNTAALAAAYGGVEEYQSRLADDPTYLKYGNPASYFSKGTTDPLAPDSTLVALPPIENKAFGLGTSGTWATVAGSGGASTFRYEVDNSKYAQTGTLRVRSTGRVGNQTRTIIANLRQQGFVDFLYFTDYEIQDPDFSGANVTNCVKYAWAGRPQPESGGTNCGEIAFSGGDTVDGPAHSNDKLRVCSARFKGQVTTGWNTTGLQYNAHDSLGASCTGQVFDAPGYPKYSPVVAMPSSNTQLKRETRTDLTATDVPRPGCLYTGPTSIVFNADATVTVRSPWTKKTRIVGDPATTGSTPAECGVISELQSTAGSTFTPPANNVLYVQSVPATSSDPNYWATTAQPNTSSCLGTPVAGKTTPAGNGIGYPAAKEVAPSTDSYGCRDGDLFISGTLDGNMTVAADKYVYVVGDVKDEDASNDMLGIVGNNAVFVWNPVDSSNKSLLPTASVTPAPGREIDAAILSVAHTFAVQNPTVGGDRGTLTVKGAIAQKFRGIVRSGTNGYIKNYVYDSRLRYTAPPKFLSPVSTTYGINTWVEVTPVMVSSGAYR